MTSTSSRVVTPASVDFLCIGAQRSGTSWLSRNLRAHPGVWVVPCKETHYFSRSPRYHSPSHLACRNWREKLLGTSQEARTWRWMFRVTARRLLANAPPGEKLRRLRWIATYFFGTVNDEWYCSLFREGAGRIRGELTPDYALLESDDVARVAALLPDVKLIALLRDPVDRVLSQLRYHMDGRAEPDLGRASARELVEFANAEGQILRGDYPRMLGIWGSVFSASRIHLAYYDDVCSRPDEVLDGILRFLGVDPVQHRATEPAAFRVNSASSRDLSSETVARVAAAHAGVVQDCADHLGGHAVEWFENCKRRIDAAR